MKIAVVGTGISGMGAAYLLDSAHDVTVYEKNSYIGGHSRTIDVSVEGKKVSIDTGFIVYNRENYPLLTALFEHLGVEVEKSDMSFGVSIADGWLEYSSKALFAQISNLLWRTGFCRMLRDTVRFNKRAHAWLDAPPDITLGECLDKMKMGRWFRDYYLKPMGAAIWSCSTQTILEYPARTFLQFFKNHGLLTIKDHPQWYTVKGGSREYIKKITKNFTGEIRLNCGVSRVLYENGKIVIHDTAGGVKEFDHVILACHADQSLSLLGEVSDQQRSVLGAFQFQNNKIIVHSDINFMPRRKKAWASWIYLSEGKKDTTPVVSLTYWMNLLQNLKTDKPLLVTLNPGRRPQENLIYDEHEFSHPIFTVQALAAQEKIETIQGLQNVWYCGAWQRYGFHEDGLLSAVKVAKKLGVNPPWV